MRLIKVADVMVEKVGPGALDRMGFAGQRIVEQAKAEPGLRQGVLRGQRRSGENH